MNKIWYQKHRPTELNKYVFTNKKFKEKVEEWIEKKDFPPLLFSGNPGSGKTSLAQLLVEQCGFEEIDVKVIQASINRGINDFTDEVLGFAENQSFGKLGRVVILDEADELSAAYQKALRNIIGDAETQCRFILTCNYPHKIIDALKSRLKHYTFDALNKNEFAYRCAEILSEEKVTFDLETLESFVDKYYPDLRKTINNMQDAVHNGVLEAQTEADGEDGPDWMKEVVVYFQQGNIRKAREQLISQISYEDYEFFYKLLYQNLEWFAGDDENKKQDKMDACLFAIKDAYVDDKSVANREIILSACLIKLDRIRRS